MSASGELARIPLLLSGHRQAQIKPLTRANRRGTAADTAVKTADAPAPLVLHASPGSPWLSGRHNAPQRHSACGRHPPLHGRRVRRRTKGAAVALSQLLRCAAPGGGGSPARAASARLWCALCTASSSTPRRPRRGLSCPRGPSTAPRAPCTHHAPGCGAAPTVETLAPRRFRSPPSASRGAAPPQGRRSDSHPAVVSCCGRRQGLSCPCGPSTSPPHRGRCGAPTADAPAPA
jgi:hypothetical protein